MPMNFPDSETFPYSGSLVRTAQIHKFRSPNEGETQDAYREALADHVAPIDRVESEEIRFKVGWDQWTDAQKRESIMRGR